MKKIYVFYSQLVCIVILSVAAQAQEVKTNEDLVVGIATYPSLNDSQRQAFLDAYDSQLSALENALIHQFNNSVSNDVQFGAAYMLGRLRSSQAVPFLARMIATRNEMKSRIKMLPRWMEFPNMEALINIGSASIPAMIGNIETSDNREVRELSTKVIKYVEGKEVALFRIQRQIERSKNDKAIRNLKEALEYAGTLSD